MKKKRLITCLALLSALCACQHNNGLKPTALQQYIAKIDAQATVQAMHKPQHAAAPPHKQSQKTAVTEHLYTDPLQLSNKLYDSAGNLVFSGGPINQEQLVRLNRNGSTTVVEDFLSDPQGNYIGFTPKAIYHINKGTGQHIKIPRQDFM